MASADILPPGTPTLLGPSNETIAGLTEQIQKLSLENPHNDDPPSEDVAAQPRSRVPLVYTRSQALQLYKSPLVQAPDGMPQLKDWFGDWSEQSSSGKKDAESSTTTNGTRDRRFRRDAEEGADPSRPNFRSALSQPSQMGNFKHQPLRGSDRDKERERDLRDKEGQDRLRSLSDKFDRERLSLSSAGALRGKERELAPHLTSTAATTRLTSQAQPSSTSRRADGRETSTRKRAGDNADDWRRGGEGRGRDDKSDNTRNDRDDEPRARARNGSRSRREASTTRRDRDREDRDKERDRDGDRNRRRSDRDRDREDREREERPVRRAREHRDTEGEDDSRHWRDDGKRDERVGTRRDRDRERDRDIDRIRERDWERYDKAAREDTTDRPRDRDRWDEREPRTKRGGGRDRKGAGDEARDREDKDKEPAWMGDYAPETSGGILGGKGLEGELDELQAWKKSMKERDQRATGASSGRKASGPVTESSEPEPAPANGGGGLDEIQQFKLIMKKAQEGKPPAEGLEFGPALTKGDASSKVFQPSSEGSAFPAPSSTSITSTLPTAPLPTATPAAPSESSNPLLALLSPPSNTNPAPRLENGLNPPLDRSPASLTPSGPSLAGQPSDPSRLAQNQGNPISGSRFFGKRAATTAAPVSRPPPELAALSPTVTDPSSFQASTPISPFAADGQQFQEPPRRTIADAIFLRERQAAIEAMRAQQSGGYSPSNQGFSERGNDIAALSQIHDYRRSMTESPVSPYTDVGPGAGLGGMDPGLGGRGGSRFAKLWDGDARGGRPGHVAQPRAQNSVDLGGYPSPPVGRQDSGGLSNMSNADQLFALLGGQQRRTPVSQLNHTPPNPASFTVNYPNNQLGQQQLGQQQLGQQQLGQQQLPLQQPYSNGARQDILHESRIDDRFMPDNMVPGLRTTPLNRTRDAGGSYYGADPLDDPYGGQRLPPLQARGLDPMLSGHPQASAHLRNPGLPLQQGQFRGGPSPIQLQGQQRGVPVGLANLGSRPPHDPGQYIGAPMGMGPSLSGQSSQGGYNNLNGGGMGGYGGAPQMRGPPGVPNALAQGGLGGMGVQGMDPRSTQAQLLGLGGPGPMRTAGAGYGVPQGLGGPIPGAHMGSRQVPQQHFMQGQNMQGMMGQMQQGPGPAPSQDLMALLMGGRRE